MKSSTPSVIEAIALVWAAFCIRFSSTLSYQREGDSERVCHGVQPTVAPEKAAVFTD
jgi:hypothetical protein